MRTCACHWQGADCKHAPYLNSLPERHDCLMSWSDEERAMLQGTGKSLSSAFQSGYELVSAFSLSCLLPLYITLSSIRGCRRLSLAYT